MIREATIPPADDPYAAVNCPEHGLVHLTVAQYNEQMMRPNSSWRCPRCGEIAWFNDAEYERLQGIA